MVELPGGWNHVVGEVRLLFDMHLQPLGWLAKKLDVCDRAPKQGGIVGQKDAWGPMCFHV